METAEPVVPATVAAFLGHWARARPDAPFVTCADAKYTFAQMHARAEWVSAGLVSLGVDRGQRVSCMSPNRPEFVELIFGLAMLGAVQAPVNIYLKGTFLQRQLQATRPAAVVVDRDGYRAMAAYLADLAELRLIVHLESVPGLIDLSAERVKHVLWSDLTATSAQASRAEASPRTCWLSSSRRVRQDRPKAAL